MGLFETKNSEVIEKEETNWRSEKFGKKNTDNDNDPVQIVKKHSNAFGVNERTLAEELLTSLETNPSLVINVLNLLNEKEKKKTASIILKKIGQAQINNMSDESINTIGDLISASGFTPKEKGHISDMLKEREENINKKQQDEEEKRKAEAIKKKENNEKDKKKAEEASKNFKDKKLTTEDFSDLVRRQAVDAEFKKLTLEQTVEYQKQYKTEDNNIKYYISEYVLNKYLKKVEDIKDLKDKHAKELREKFVIQGEGNDKKFFVWNDKEGKLVELKDETATTKDKKQIITLVEASYNRLLKKHKDTQAATFKKERQKVADALSQRARETAALLVTSKVDGYLARTDISDKQKVETIEKMVHQLGKMELLLGTMYYGEETWEEQGADKGKFPSHYQKEVTNTDGYYWCLIFIGYLYKKIGLSSKIVKTPQLDAFWSTYKFEKWAGEGQNISGKEVVPSGERVKDKASGGEYMGNKDWAKLTKALTDTNTKFEKDVKEAVTGIAKTKETNKVNLEKADKILKAAKSEGEKKKAQEELNKIKATGEKTLKDAEQKLKEKKEGKPELVRNEIKKFFTSYPSPRPGDIILRIATNNTSPQHAAMVDKFDDKNYIIYTIEGNLSQRMKGEKLDLKNIQTVKGIGNMARLGAKWMGNYKASDANSKILTDEEHSPVQNALVQPLSNIVERFLNVAFENDWVKSNDPTKSAYEWLGNKEETNQTFH
jgi:hypothetical protein